MEVASHFTRKIILSTIRCQTSALSKVLPAVSFTRTIHSTSVLLGAGVLKKDEDPQKVTRAQWLKRLTPEQFYVCREKGTELPFSGEYVNNDESGTYNCVCCGTPLFNASTKFESGSGWPAFYDVIMSEGSPKSSVRSRRDNSHGMFRTEVMCRKCDAHLGHVFNDGPKPTGLRYCINSIALEFEQDEPPGES